MMTNRTIGLARWFLASGCVGLLVALVLMEAAGARRLVSTRVLLVLWPSSIAGLADPRSGFDKFIVGAFEFGGNFILYGVIGLLIGTCVKLSSVWRR